MNGDYVNATAAAQPEAGLEKWVLIRRLVAPRLHAPERSEPGRAVHGARLSDRRQPGDRRAPWSPATDGLRALTGRVGRDGIATIWAVTSTVSGGGDTGADPDKLMMISDPVWATTPPPWERFWTLRTAKLGQILRGVSFTPGTATDR